MISFAVHPCPSTVQNIMSLIRLHEILPLGERIIQTYVSENLELYRIVIFTLAPNLLKKTDARDAILIIEICGDDRLFTRELTDHELEYLATTLKVNIEKVLRSHVYVKLVKFSDVDIDIVISQDPITDHTELYLAIEE